MPKDNQHDGKNAQKNKADNNSANGPATGQNGVNAENRNNTNKKPDSKNR